MFDVSLELIRVTERGAIINNFNKIILLNQY